MFRRKSKRIQYWRLRRDEIISKAFLLGGFFWVLSAQGQHSAISQFHDAEIAFHTSKWSEALKLYLKLYQDTSRKPTAIEAYRISQCYEQFSKPQEALNYAERAHDLDTQESTYTFRLAELYEKQYRYQEAWPLRLNLLRKEPRFISRHLSAIQNARNRNDYNQCIELSQNWIASFGRGEFITEILAWAYLKNNELDKAIASIDSLIAKYPKRTDYLAKKQEWLPLTKTGKSSTAAQSNEPSDTKFLDWVRYSFNQGNINEAYELLVNITREQPDNLLAWEYLFLGAYINADSATMYSCIENLEMLFPFLDEPQQGARTIVEARYEHKFSSDLISKASLPAIWEYIRLDLWVKNNQESLAVKHLNKLRNSSSNPVEPQFFIEKLNLNVPVK